MITILGARGFIGSHLVAALQSRGEHLYMPNRDDPEILDRDLGRVIYCIGLTADFRTRPFDTVRAHVGVLNQLLERARFSSLTYLSSTRVYGRAAAAHEDTAIPVQTTDPSDLYNISKLMGESLCLGSGRQGTRVVRMSNVLGDDFYSENLVMALIRQAVREGRLELNSAPASEKDFVLIDDVVDMLPRIAFSGKQHLYNLASGINLSFAEIAQAVADAAGCGISWRVDAPIQRFPSIDISRVQKEFGFAPRRVLDIIPALVERYRRSLA